MALVTNIKGYINDEEWGVFEPSSLKSYEEIIAMSAANAVAELNTYPSDYYDKFNSEGHIVGSSNFLGYSSSAYYYYIYNFADGTYKDQDEAIAPFDELVNYNNGGWAIYS